MKLKSSLKVGAILVFSVLNIRLVGSVSEASDGARSQQNPGARWGHVFVYDPIRDEVLLFGGAQDRGCPYLHDTWTWDGQTWKHHEVTTPPARGFAAAAFHPIRGEIILHGGRNDDQKTFSDTWAWDGSAWHELEADGPFQSDHHQMVYVVDDSILFAFGGYNWNTQDVSGDSWIWDDAWQRLPASGPRKRGAFAMTYDVHQKCVILFGGLWLDGQYADLWQWSDKTWSRLGGPYDHSSLDHHAMVYDSKRHQVVLFGGKNYRYRPLNNTMTLHKNRLQIVTAEGPSPRHSLGLAYNDKLDLVLLYGGKEYLGEDQGALGDFWCWNGEKWQKIE